MPLVLEGLKRLEYRGYDSAGIATQQPFEVLRAVGKIAQLEPKIIGKHSTIVIGHTRWATHGEPSELNAHPHKSEDGSVAIVHNGIIENHADLRADLIKKGVTFKSETDSEIIAHLIAYFYKGDFEEAFRKMLSKITGAYGIVAMHKDHEELLVAKKGSPLVIGVGDKEYFIGSDASPFLDHTKDAIYLDERQMGVLTKTGYEIKDFDGFNLDVEIETIPFGIEAIQKHGFDHFMLKEIFEQPETVANAFRGKVKNIDGISLTLPSNLRRVLLLACGTSWHAALIGKYILERSSRIEAQAEHASEFRYRSPVLHNDDLVIALSQSGETADTLEALRLAKEAGATIAGIVNATGSTIAKFAGQGMYLHAGPEIGVASTKAFTSQVVALNLLNLYLNRNATYRQEIINYLKRIPEQIQFILDDAKVIENIAKEYAHASDFLFLGRDIHYPVALEGALKLKEISYIHAEGYPAAEMKHGPIALIDESMPCVFIVTEDNLAQKTLSNMQEVKSRKGKIICVCDFEHPEISNLADHVIKVPKTTWELSPLLTNIPLQLLSYYIARERGCEIDKPRNLAKSVTVE
ncbi:glutamine--fructose-6-phosphate transaminase (isomerizing) [Candidatus Woesearchaeota archaeon]|nr:MAG: glutamine--fructose-6-phosphate transaminase (isomerizing) [Candidatus Woesearchaeota archaeon]